MKATNLKPLKGNTYKVTAHYMSGIGVTGFQPYIAEYCPNKKTAIARAKQCFKISTGTLYGKMFNFQVTELTK